MVDVGGARVHVRRYAAPGARCALLLFHGNGEVVADYDDVSELYAKLGIALVAADFRGYGQSDGEPALRHIVEDARVIAAWMGNSPFVVMGRSLGGVAAHELYARPVAGMVGVVLESALSDLRGLIQRRGIEPPAAFTPDELAAFDPSTKLALGRLPLLVLHGAHDTLIDPREARATLAAAGSADKKLVFVPGRGHNDLSLDEAYWLALAEFVDRIA
jgi:fermentation-respiration switch protein FrsA (DUF1100 family)